MPTVHLPSSGKQALGGARLSKTENKTYTCPKCGWTVKTPFGEEDNADQIKLHNAKHHGEGDKTLRAKISKTDLLKLQ
jgi:hypothetical protein